MGIILSIFMIAAGGALTRSDGSAGTVNGMNPDAAGLVLIGAGIVWFVLSVMLWNAFRERETTEPRVIQLRGARSATQSRTTGVPQQSSGYVRVASDR